MGAWLPANTLSNQHSDNNSNRHHCQFRATTSHTTATATAAMDIDDWQSIEDTGVTPASGMEQELEPPEESRPSDPEQIRLKLPSGSTLHIREVPAEKLQEAAPPAAAASGAAAAAAADSGRLWRAIVTNRRWNSTVQMLQNKLRQEERGANILRDAFTAAAEDFVLPGRLSQQDLEAKISHLASSAEQWSTWLEPVVERLRKPEKPTKQGQPSPADAELIEQAKSALLFAVCCVYGACTEGAEMSLESEAQMELVAVPASLQVVVKGQATLAFATTLLDKLVNEANLGYFDSVSFDMDLKGANRRHAELQTLAKQAARERQLYGRRRCKSDGDSEPLSAPGAAVVACTFTLRGSDSSVLKQMGDQAAQALRAEAAKRRKEEEEGGAGRGKMKKRKKHAAAAAGGGAQDKPTKLAAALAETLLTAE